MASDRKRILILLGSNRYGGAEKHCLDLLNLHNSEWQISLGLPMDSPLVKVVPKDQVVLLPGLGNWLSWVCMSEFRRKASGFDLVHAHMNKAAALASLSFLQKPWIATVHGFSSPLPYVMASGLIAVSEAIRASLPVFMQRRTELIYNGISNPTQHARCKESTFKVIVLATIHPNKGQEFTVNALKGWVDFPKDMEVLLVGTGLAKHEKSLSKSLDQCSVSIRWVPHMGDIESYWQQAQLVLIPSYKEALSYVALEAQARKIRVLASATGGLLESVKPGFGQTFTVSCAKSLQQALLAEYKIWKADCGLQPQSAFLNLFPEFRLDSMLKGIENKYQRFIAL